MFQRPIPMILLLVTFVASLAGAFLCVDRFGTVLFVLLGLGALVAAPLLLRRSETEPQPATRVDDLTELHKELREAQARYSELEQGLEEARGVAAQLDQQLRVVEYLRQTVDGMLQSHTDLHAHEARAGEVARASAKNVDATYLAVQESRKSMEELFHYSQQITQVFTDLTAQSERIGDIVTSIQDIATQTNLLALNAAIEAASAGRVGQGFSVVAEAVRELAERANQSSHEVGEIAQGLRKTAVGARGQVALAGDSAKHGLERTQAAIAAMDAVLEGAKRRVEIIKAAQQYMKTQHTDCEDISQELRELEGLFSHSPVEG